MIEKICGFGGEPIAGGLQEHDFASCAHNLRDRVIQLEAELKKSVKANVMGLGINESLQAENERLRHLAKEGLEWSDENINNYLEEALGGES